MTLFSETANSVAGQKLTYLSSIKLNRIEHAIRDILSTKTPGAVAEFGVALGGCSIVLAKVALASGRSFHGFDVFEQIPPPTDNDGDDVHQRYAKIASGHSKGIRGDKYYGYRKDLLGDVTRSFAANGIPVDDRMVFLHKGLFEHTWTPAGIDHIAVAHIDCDWYEPVKFCLGLMRRHLIAGGVAIVDDYHAYSGCRRATDEFLAENPDFDFDDGPNVILRRKLVPPKQHSFLRRMWGKRS